MSVKKLAKRFVPIGVFDAAVPYWHLLRSVVFQTKAGFPAKHIEVIGVTGTDGKTTTSTLITHMLRSSGKKVAMMTTISVDYGDGKGPQANPTRLTTFGAADLASSLSKMKQEGVEYLVLEVTSHALAQHRIWGVPISVAVMTNIGHEHLDYHKTFERYRDAKRRLFTQAIKNKKGKQIGVINAEDPSAKLFASDVQNPLLYGTSDDANLRATDVQLTPDGSVYTALLTGEGGQDEAMESGEQRAKSEAVAAVKNLKPETKNSLNITCNLPGSFNVYNSLAAASVGISLGLSKDQIEQGIASLDQVEGRMTRVDEGQNFSVIVDYAHTPESFDKLFAELKPLAKGRLICVFGSAGRRDEAKRARQGEIAGKWCDIVIATEEDDRDIDREEILRQIVSGAVKAGKVLNKDVLMVGEREEAVQMAIHAAKKDDLVVLLGKGHEKSILFGGPKAAELRHLPQDDSDERRVLKRPYDEVKVAQKALQALKNKK